MRRAQQHGHVQVVAAGVHHACLAPIRVYCLYGTGVVQSGLLFHRQGVHVAADQHPGARTVFQHGHHAKGLRSVFVFAHMLGYRVTQLAQLGSHKGRGLLLVLRELGIAMQMLISLGESG